jgi:hypothetical protein
MNFYPDSSGFSINQFTRKVISSTNLLINSTLKIAQDRLFKTAVNGLHSFL